jgi:hypothetical protein
MPGTSAGMTRKNRAAPHTAFAISSSFSTRSQPLTPAKAGVQGDAVMPGHSRSKNGVLSHAYVPGIHVQGSMLRFPVMPGLVPGIHVLAPCNEDVDGRNKSGHDD